MRIAPPRQNDKVSNKACKHEDRAGSIEDVIIEMYKKKQFKIILLSHKKHVEYSRLV